MTVESTPARMGGGLGLMRNVSDAERWASGLLGGALTAYGLVRRDRTGMALAVIGGDMIFRGLTGHSTVYSALKINTADNDPRELEVRKTMTINRPAADLYRFWRDFSNLPGFMRHLQSVTDLGEGRSHWIVSAPMGKTVEWDAKLTEDQPDRMICWESLPGADIENSGEVEFKDSSSGRGAEVRVKLTYRSPAGATGAIFAKIFGEEPAQQVRDELRSFKSMMEAGEIPTTEGQPSGRSGKS